MKRPNILDISILCGQLSLMLSTGISVFKALDTLEIQCNKISLRLALNTVKEDVIKGKSIHRGMERFKKVFPVFMVEMIKIGEESGRLDEILKKLSFYYEKQYNVISSIKTSLIYPALILITGVFIMLFLMTKIIPTFTDIIISSGGEIPILTKVVIRSCEFLRLHYMKIFMVLILMLVLLYKFSKNTKVKRILENIKIKTPYFGNIYNNLIIFKICSSMSILMKSGINIVKGFKITSKLLENRVIAEKIQHCVKYMEQGESIYDSLNKAQINNKMLLSLINTGEETGEIDMIFSKLEELFRSQMDRYFKKLTKIIEPIVIVFLSLFVGTFVIAALMPIFSIMDSTL
ncbi:type II secretion system F family protein [Clostridium sp. WILCCON 0269]|uniref:Type II secretion system F family protein n=1 Tax=Candidatus Clostridium eludens TaxID=3381663 RepID=A0ABW8SNE5_9CLOT